MTETLLTRQEAADRLKVSIVTFDRMIKAGKLPRVRIGRRVMVRESDLNAYIDANTETGTATE